MRRLFSPDSAEGVSCPTDGQRTEPPAAPAAPPAPTPPTPPAATTVATGEVTEETLRLREEKAALETKLKEREIEVATVKDTHERYRQAVEAVPVKKGPVVTKPNKVIAFGCMRRRA